MSQPTFEKQMAELAKYNDIDLEGLGSIAEWLSNVTSQLNNTISILFNTKVHSLTAKPNDPKRVQKGLSKLVYTEYSPISVFTPKGLSGYMQELAEQLNENVKDLRGLETRTYDPLIRYMATVTSDPEKAESLWFDNNLKTMDHTKNIKKTKALYEGKEYIEGPADEMPFGEAYGSSSALGDTYKYLGKASVGADGIPLDNFEVKEKRLGELTKLFVEMHEKGEIDVNSKSLKLIINAFRATAAETQWLVFNFFQLSVINTAFNDSLDKIKTDIL